MKRFKQSQKLRVILNGIAVYTTVKQIRGCQFGFYEQNAAAQKALESLEFSRTYSAKWMVVWLPVPLAPGKVCTSNSTCWFNSLFHLQGDPHEIGNQNQSDC